MDVIEIMAQGIFEDQYGHSAKGETHPLERQYAKAAIKALHDAGYVVRPMTGKIPVEITAHEGSSPYVTEIRCRADIRDGTLGALQSMDSARYQDAKFRTEYLPVLIADSLLGVILPQLREDIAKALVDAPVDRKGEDA